MNWALAAAPTAIVGLVFWATGFIHPAIVAYHLLCLGAIHARRDRIRALFRIDRATACWATGLTGAIAVCLAAAPLVHDPTPYRELFRAIVTPGSRAELLFWIFAAYTMVIHAPLEEIFWRAAVMDPESPRLSNTIAGNAFFFYLLHALPMAMVLGAQGLLFALPAAAAGGAWAFVTIRSRSLWPALVSHWGADGLILGGMWFYFIR
jgi:membrane protease YdiL (CAAX protease family)